MNNAVLWKDRLEAIEKLSHKNKVRFIMRCVQSKNPCELELSYFEMANKWLNDEITGDECRLPFKGVYGFSLIAAYSPMSASSLAEVAIMGKVHPHYTSCNLSDQCIFLDHTALKDLMRYLWELNVQQDLEDVLFSEAR